MKLKENRFTRSFVGRFLLETVSLYNDRQVPKAAAAMSYHLTMTFFPLIICLYALFGQNFSTAVRLLDSIRRFLTADAADMIENYLQYLSEGEGRTITVIAVTFLLSSSSAAIRALMNTVYDIQGARRFGVVSGYLMSFALAVGLLVVFYFAFVVLLTGDNFISYMQEKFPTLGRISDWTWARFLILGGIALTALWLTFTLLKPRGQRFRVLPGAALSTLAIVLMSYLFSAFIAASARYQLVYGSLATIILLMFWLYLTCQMIFLGECVNIALRNVKRQASEAVKIT